MDQEPTITKPESPASQVKTDSTEIKAAADEQHEGAAPEKKSPKKRRKAKRTVQTANVQVLATCNNTIVTVADTSGNKLSSASAGSSGFRGSKKGTAYAAQVAAEKAITEAKQTYGVTTVDVMVRGVGLGREAAIRTLVGQRLNIQTIRDVTGMPHGGVRPRRPKRN